jgi:hypothetical protein
MLGIVALVFIFAYGRMSKSLGLRSFAILAIIALVLTYLSAMILHVPFGGNLVVPALLQFAFQVVLFVLGCLLGRWLDRNKDLA